jgi:uncharacterized membrane protein YcaP (DUF421 family)
MQELMTSWSQVGWILVRTLTVYIFIMIGFRLSGKREVGQLAPFDFALILLIANAVQNAMVGSDTSLVAGLVAAGLLLIVNYLLGRLAVRFHKVEHLLRGRARILVNRGQVDQENLIAERLSHEELMQALRENGCATLKDCRLAVLEVDGTISVIEERPHPASEGQS